jgi:hypothetical protein
MALATGTRPAVTKFVPHSARAEWEKFILHATSAQAQNSVVMKSARSLVPAESAKFIAPAIHNWVAMFPGRGYDDAARDGKRFLVASAPEVPETQQIYAVVNWTADLKQRRSLPEPKL